MKQRFTCSAQALLGSCSDGLARNASEPSVWIELANEIVSLWPGAAINH